MLVSSSFFAAYNIMSFYTGVVVTLGTAIRAALIFTTSMGWQFETTVPDSIIKIVEAIHIKRHEEDLVGEEECYRILQEIMRQPEFIRQLSGSTLRGSMDPIYDRMNEKDRKKYKTLDQFERQGFDVSKMRDVLNEKYDIQDGIALKSTIINNTFRQK